MVSCTILVQVGDGTTTVTLLASEFLKQVKPFIEEGVHAQVAVKSFRKAANLVSEFRRSVFVMSLVLTLKFSFQKLTTVL